MFFHITLSLNIQEAWFQRSGFGERNFPFCETRWLLNKGGLLKLGQGHYLADAYTQLFPMPCWGWLGHVLCVYGRTVLPSTDDGTGPFYVPKIQLNFALEDNYFWSKTGNKTLLKRLFSNIAKAIIGLSTNTGNSLVSQFGLVTMGMNSLSLGPLKISGSIHCPIYLKVTIINRHTWGAFLNRFAYYFTISLLLIVTNCKYFLLV